MRLIDADDLPCHIIEINDINTGVHRIPVYLVETVRNAPTVEAVILPCPLGTTLYRVCEERLNRKPFIRVVQFNRNNFTRIVLDGEIGKTAFLTREEAEAALAKMA